MKKKVKANLIYNPLSGQIWNPFKPEVVVEYLEKFGWEVKISPTQTKGDGSNLARISVSEKYDVVIAAGGDGTINEVIQGLAGTDVLLAILPVGTTNVLARELKIPLNFQEAMTILPQMNTVLFDLGMINKQYFILMAGIGFDAQLVSDVDSGLKKFTGLAAFAAASPVSVMKHKPAKMQINLWYKTGRRKKLNRKCYQILISNASTYANDWVISPNARFDDGLLDLDIFHTNRFFDFAIRAFTIVFKKRKADNSTEHYNFTKMSVKTDPPSPIQVDGDFVGYTPAFIEIKPKCLKILKP